jgi:hypothetical protein
MDVVNVENAGVFFHQLAYIHVGIQQEKVILKKPSPKGKDWVSGSNIKHDPDQQWAVG